MGSSISDICTLLAPVLEADWVLAVVPSTGVESFTRENDPGSPDEAGFGGSWSNYPFFESGIIVVTSRMEGIFILRKRERTVLQ